MIHVERSYPAPASLAVEAQKNSGKYDKEDVIEQLKRDFHNKCYICGINHLQDPQVEHLLPHKNGKYPDRKFDWENLFWSCGHCNGVKNKDIYDEGIIDCCKTDPEASLKFCVTDENVYVTATDKADAKSKLTAQLVEEVFNLKNTGMRVYKSDMRYHELVKEMNILYETLAKWKKNPGSRVENNKLKALLRRESKFAEFKRCYVREHVNDYQDVIKYIA